MTAKERVRYVVEQYAKMAERAAKRAEQMAERRDHINWMAEALSEEGAAELMLELEAKGLLGPDDRILAFVASESDAALN